jgi:uncharacterized protein (UPF0548 family)
VAGPRRSSFRANQVTYAAVGVTQDPDVLRFPPVGFHARRNERRIGSGRDRFAAASADLLNGAFFERAGLDAMTAQGEPLSVEALRLESPTVRLANVWWPMNVVRDFRVIYAVREERRVAFALGTLTEWPLSGEESFVVEWREDDTVWSQVTTVTQLNSHWSIKLIAPVVRLREHLLRIRYTRALNPVKSAT